MPIAAVESSRAVSHAVVPTDRIVESIAALLRELRVVIGSLSDAAYAQRPVGPIDSNIGGHVRHSLDHLDEIIHHGPDPALSYDHRERGTPVESNRHAAIAKIDAMLQRLCEPLNQSVEVNLSAMVSATGEPVKLVSTLERELLYVFSHTLHHNALIRILVLLQGGTVPERFGYAPSTIAHLDSAACAH